MVNILTDSVIPELYRVQGEYRVQIYYEDTDFSGYVYHPNYLKYYDRAREEIVGLDRMKQLQKLTGIHFVVARVEIKYLAPARFGDVLIIRSTTEFSELPSHTYIQEAFINDKKINTAEIRIVAVDEYGRPTRLPNEALELLVESPYVHKV